MDDELTKLRRDYTEALLPLINKEEVDTTILLVLDQTLRRMHPTQTWENRTVTKDLWVDLWEYLVND